MTDRPSPVQVRPGSFDEALSNGRRLLEQDPASALKQAETLIRIRQDARVYRLAAEACRKLGMKADAEGAELGAIQAGLTDPLAKRISLALEERKLTEALTLARPLLRKDPNDLLARTFVAESLNGLWDLDEAEDLLRSVLERAPAFLRASMLLATCLSKQVRMRDGIAVLEEVVARKPNNVAALNLLAQSRAGVGDLEEAASLYQRLLNLDPKVVWSVFRAQHLRATGHRQEAIAALRQALEIDPLNGSAWWTFVNYYREEISQEDEGTIRRALVDRAGTPDEGSLHLALGMLAERRRELSEAFRHFVTGKEIRLADQPFNPEPISTAVDGVIQTMTSEFYERRSRAGFDGSSPIFIVGMPRSGTTLVERILGRHSMIEGAGELQIIPRLAEIARHQTDRPEDYAAMLETLADDQLAWVGRRYVECSKDYRHTDKPFFIDKANLNWMQIGLILLALPNARVIDVRRDALDCCWANFKMLFAEAFPAANDLRHVGRFYRDYVRLLDAMRDAAPGRILPVRYIDVVDDIEGQTRRILEFIGLEFEPACLDFHLSQDAVATASSEQVRQPLNRKGIGSAEPYRQWLGPLIEELGPLAG